MNQSRPVGSVTTWSHAAAQRLMIGVRAPLVKRRVRAGIAGIAAVVCLPMLLGACGTSATPQASSATASACRQVSAALSDGPDPTADPIGYAEAQILPLQQVHTSDAALRSAIDHLDAVYRQVVSTNRPETPAVNAASARVDALCPGAAS